MAKQVDFSIIVVTYNRNERLKECLNSFKQQSNGSFEVVVIDRGSEPSAEPVVTELNDIRFTYKKSSQEIHFCDVVNEAIKYINGKYLCVFGDDDCIHKKTLELVAKTFQMNKDSDLVMIGSCSIRKGSRESILFPSHFSTDNNFGYFQPETKLLKFSGKDWIKYILSVQFIGKKIECNFPTYIHPSTTFIKRSELFDKVVKQQGGIAVKPSFDSGYIGLAYYTNIVYINAPLAIITFGVDNVSVANRRFWDKETKDIKYMPKISQLENRGADSLLNVLHLNNIQDNFDTHIQLKLYRMILRSILKDPIWDRQTLKDICVLFLHYFRDSKIKIDVLYEYTKQILSNCVKYFSRKEKIQPQKSFNKYITAGQLCNVVDMLFNTQIGLIEIELNNNKIE